MIINNIGYNLPENTKAIHGTVFITLSEDDHFTLVMGTLPLCTQDSCSLWATTRGTFFGTPSNWDNSDNIILTYYGDADMFSSFFGIQYTSLTIPITLDKKLYWDATGRNNAGNKGNGTFILFVRGYYAT